MTAIATAQLADLADTGIDASDALQAILDGPRPVISLPPGEYVVNRPLVARCDFPYIGGAPRATIRASGGFSPLMVGFPKRKRWPGFAEAHRVEGPADGYFAYRLAKDAYVSLRATPFEFGPARNWDEIEALTIAFALRRERGDIVNITDNVLCTDPDRGKADPIDISVQGRRTRVTILTTDDTERYLDILTPTAARELFIVLALDLKTGGYQAYANGVAAEVRTNVTWGPNLRIRWPDMSDCRIGKSPLVGPADITFFGLKFTPKVVVPMGVPVGTPLARNDGKKGTDGNPVGFAAFLWDRHYLGETILDMRRTSVDSTVPELVAVRGGWAGEKRGYGMILPNGWGSYDVCEGVAVRGLNLRVGEDYQGSALAWGTCLGLHLADLDLYGGVRGIDQWPPVTTYPALIERCHSYGQADAGFVFGFGIMTARDLTVGTGPAPRSHYGIKNRCCDGIISDVFVAQMESVRTVVRIGELMGRLTLDRIRTDWEDFGPECYLKADRGQAGRGKSAVIHMREFGASRAPRDGRPYFCLSDPFKGRTDVGFAKLVVEDSLDTAWPGPLLSREGAWQFDVKGTLGAGIVLPSPGPLDPGTAVP